MYPTEMDREQRLFLVDLNNKLFEIEKQLKKEALEIIDTLDKRIHDQLDWINYYEIEAMVEFFLKRDDPQFSEYEDNTLAEFSERLSFLKCANESALASEENWNNLSLPNLDHPDQQEHHCLFYNKLYDHVKIKWKDMLRIGDIWVNINITLLHHLKLSLEKEGESG